MGGKVEREKLKRRHVLFHCQTRRAKATVKGPVEDFRIMASLFGCVNGTQPMYDA